MTSVCSFFPPYSLILHFFHVILIHAHVHCLNGEDWGKKCGGEGSWGERLDGKHVRGESVTEGKN